MRSPDFPAVGRIRRRDGVALDPALEAELRGLARGYDEPAIREALAYAARGRVLLARGWGDELVTGLVAGRHPHGIRFGPDEEFACTCPSYRDRCKHVLAAWLVLRSGAVHG